MAQFDLPALPLSRFPALQRIRWEYVAFGAVLVLGLLLRIVLAPSPGFEYDVGVNKGWGRSAVELGLARSYVEQVNGNMLPNYAPFSIMLFAAAALAQRSFFGGFDSDPLSYHILIKLPTILADLGTAAVLFFLVRRWKGTRAGILAALVYALHPAVLHDGAFWGQTDTIYALFLAAAMSAFVFNRFVFFGAFLALAALSKMQAVALFPLFGILTLRGGWRRIMDVLLGGLLVTVPVLLPFALGGTLDNVLNVYWNSVGFNSIVSSAAYNFWWSLYGDEAGMIQDTALLVGPLSHRTVGFLLFGASNLFAMIVLWRSLKPSPSDLRTLPAVSLACAFAAFSFFLWNTQMHERYLFPFIALGLPFAFLSFRAALLYFLISFLYYVNLLGWLPAGTFDHALFVRFTTLDVFVASSQLLLFFPLAYEAWRFRRSAMASLL